MTAPAYKLPTPVYNGKTRTGNEVLVYYNLGASILLGRLARTSTSANIWTPEATCSGGQSCPSSPFYLARVANAVGAGLSITGTAVDSLTQTFVDKPPIGAALEINGLVIGDIATTVLAGGAVGDTVEIICVPDPANDILICYDEALNANEGNFERPVPRKFSAVDHYVRQRSENTLSLSDMYVGNMSGVSRLRGRDVTVIAKFFPEGGGIPSELIYISGVRFTSIPKAVPANGNDSIKIDATANFSHMSVISPAAA